MANYSFTLITISGVDVSIYLNKWTAKRAYNNDIGEAQIIVTRNISALFTIDNSLINRPVIIQRGVLSATEETKFRGSIERYEVQGGIVTLYCCDRMKEVVNGEITKSYDKDIDPSAGVGSEIFKDMYNNYTTLVASNTGVVNTGTTILLDQFICKNTSVMERTERLCKIYNYQAYYDPTINEARFEPMGNTTLATTLTIGDNVIIVPKWDTDSNELINSITVFGGSQEVETTESFNGTGAQTTFTLTKTPNSTKVYISSVLKTGGMFGAIGTFDYIVDPANKQIVFTVAPGVGTGNVQVNYSYFEPAPTLVSDPVSIAAYRERNTTIFPKDLYGVDDTEKYAQKRLAQMKDPYRSTTLYTNDTVDRYAGQLVNVVDNVNNVSGLFFIKTVEMNFPFRPDKIEIEDKIWRTADWGVVTADRLQRIEEELFYNQDTLRIIFNFNHSIIPRRFYTEIYTRDVHGDGAWDIGFGDAGGTVNNLTWDDTNAVWGGTDYLNALVLVERVIGNALFEEYFYSTEFKSGSTTGTWDTSNQYLTLANTNIALSTATAYGSTYTTAQLNCPLSILYDGPGYTTNSANYSNLTFYLSANGGSNWETVTPATVHTFTNTGTDLRWKILCSATNGIRLVPNRITATTLSVAVNP